MIPSTFLVRSTQSVVALLVLLVARTALACPACAGREDGGVGLFFVYAAMVFSPFVAAYAVMRVIKGMALVDGHALDTHHVHYPHNSHNSRREAT